MDICYDITRGLLKGVIAVLGGVFAIVLGFTLVTVFSVLAQSGL